MSRIIFTVIFFYFTINLIAQTENNHDTLIISNPDSFPGESKMDSSVYLQIFKLKNSGSKKFDAKNYQGSVMDFTKAIELDPNDHDLYYNRGTAKAKMALYAEALADISKAIELKPEFLVAYYNRACVKMLLKNDDGAIDDFTTLIALDSTYAYAYYGRGDIYLRYKRWELALSDANKLRDLKPEYPNSHYALGQVYKNLLQYDEAIVHYSAAIKLNEEYMDAYYSRAALYSRQRDYEKAIMDYTSAIKYCNSDPVKKGLLYSERGYCFGVLEKFGKAFHDFDDSFDLNPDDGKLYWNRGSVYGFKEQYDKSIEDFNIALMYLSTDSYSSSVLFVNIGKAYKKMDNCEEAIVNFDKAILMNPNNGNAYYYRGLCKQILNDLDAAKEDMEKAVKAQPNCNASEKYLEILKALLTKSTDNKYSIKVYPTVFTNSFNVEVSGDDLYTNNNISLILTDINGRLVKRIENINTEHVEVVIENLAPGVYFYEITDGVVKIDSGKVILE